ncbi:MAG: SMC-Scp complex subunit ScpB [Clostridia bacterium]|nr:SMC-Scp complex subunit ScpB [Clostridia bacterium]
MINTPDNENISEKQELDVESCAQIIESILFAAGYPITFKKLAEVLETSTLTVRKAVSVLQNSLELDNRGIRLIIVSDSCQLCSKEEFEQYVRKALGIRREGRLSNSSLEVLAIVAYNQPITKAKVEKIRGVDSSYAVSTLCDRHLIEAKGRLDAPGKPILYGTTDDFLRCFGLSSLFELPDYDEKSEHPDEQISMLELEDEDLAGTESEEISEENRPEEN